MRSDTDFDAISLEELRQRQSSKWRDIPDEVLPAWVAEMDVPLAAPIREALLAAVVHGDTGYVPEHPDVLARAFAGFADRRFAWKVDPGAVSMVPDVTAGIWHVLRLVSHPGDEVVLFVPAYPPFFETILDCDRRIVRSRLRRENDRWIVDFQQLEQAFAGGARVLLLNNPHNPTGKVFAREELELLLALAERHDVFVVSDEIHAPLVLPPATHIPWLTVAAGAAQRGVVLTAATKAFNIAGLKCGLLVAAGPARELMRRMPHEVAVMAGHFGFLASTVAFNHGDTWLDALIEHLADARSLFGEVLAQQAPAARWVPPAASYLAWVDLRETGLGPNPAKLILQRSALALSPGRAYDPELGDGWVRMNFGTAKPLVREIVRRLGSAVRGGGRQPRNDEASVE